MTVLLPEEAIRARLLTNASIAALIGKRIFPISASGKQPRPFICYNRFASGHNHHMGGASGLLMFRLQLDVLSDGYDTATAINEAVRNNLDGFRGTITDANGSLFFHRIELQDERYEYTPPFNSSDTGIYRFIIDLSITVAEPLPTLT